MNYVGRTTHDNGIHTFVLVDTRYNYGADEYVFACACGYECRGGAFLVRAIAAAGSYIPELGVNPPDWSAGLKRKPRLRLFK